MGNIGILERRAGAGKVVVVMEQREYLSPADVAALVGLHKRTVLAGRWRALWTQVNPRCFRVRRADLERFLSAHDA